MSDHRAGLDQDNDHPNFAPSRRELLSTLGLGLLAAPAIAGWAAPTTAHALDVGARLPPFTLPDLQGRNYQSRALRGKVAFIDIWASWCGPCAEEFPVLNRLHQQYSARGLEIVAISVDSEVAAIRRFLRRIPAQFRILHDAGRA
ncbi:MAG: TlpA family protein disulfide reductase, partial [Deltaproteobacteria bacterium]|nr:TlpA family protein disulfide reductase [Deltaproteobacteria bacterium]